MLAWKFRHKASAQGFTLIELLVVFTLLALLLTIAVPRYLDTAESSRGKVRDQNMATIRDALDNFRADQGRFPSKIEELVEKRYLRKLPLDPVSDSAEWVIVEDPAKTETGIYDIAPPNATTMSISTVTDSTDTAAPTDEGAMPVPNGAILAPGGAMPTPIKRASSP